MKVWHNIYTLLDFIRHSNFFLNYSILEVGSTSFFRLKDKTLLNSAPDQVSLWPRSKVETLDQETQQSRVLCSHLKIKVEPTFKM